MTTDDDSPRKPRKGSLGKTAAWVLLGLVVLGLGSFGVENYGGRLASIGAVGDTRITVDDYSRALRAEIDGLSQQFGTPITAQQALSLGIDRQVLQGLVERTALDHEAGRVGLSVGDEVLAERIVALPAFQGAAGTFDRETYRFTLQRNNLTEAEFEASLRRDLARSLLTGAVAGGFAAPAPMVDTLVAWAAERRGFSVLQMTAADLTAPLPEPDEAALRAFHAANPDRYTRPEAKRITYAALLPEALAEAQPVDEAAVRALYDERIDEFVIPERRLVERLVYPSEAEAAAARVRLDAGEVSFDELVAERGLQPIDADMGDVLPADLGAAAEAVFALDGPGVVGPLTSDLGPALFRMNGILAAQETTFEAAAPDLRREVQARAAREVIGDQFEAIDDALAGGATLEELGSEFGMAIATMDYIPGAQDGPDIAAYDEVRAAADALAEGDFPEAIGLSDGGIVALRLDAILPPAPIPFEEVRPEVELAARGAALAAALSARADEVAAAVTAGASLGGFGIVARTPPVPRDAQAGDAPPSVVEAAFAMTAGEVRVVREEGYIAVLRLDTVEPADPAGPDAQALRAAIAAQAEQAIAADALAAFTRALTDAAGITLDQAAISAVHAAFQ
jgi:peptidyl-prolyl cis-trans isomerase D